MGQAVLTDLTPFWQAKLSTPWGLREPDFPKIISALAICVFKFFENIKSHTNNLHKILCAFIFLIELNTILYLVHKMYNWNFYDFINQFHSNKFNKKFKKQFLNIRFISLLCFSIAWYVLELTFKKSKFLIHLGCQNNSNAQHNLQ